jgi:ABC-2 type transport system permease protein
MWGSTRAEITKLVRRPATWSLLAVALGLGLLFAYVLPYAGYAGAAEGSPNADRGLAATLPDQLVGNSIAGLPVFLGAIALILGVLAVGGEYGWGTWKTVLTQGPSRLTVYAGKLVALAVATLAGVLAMFAVGAVAGAVIAAIESAPMSWPSFGGLVVGVGAGWLIAMMWATLGVLLALVMRGVALPIGLGLVWLLIVQNLLGSLAASLLDWFTTLQKGLPGDNAGSLVASLGAASDTPGVTELVGAGQATLVVAGYLVAFAVAGGLLLHRRDVL